MKYIVKIMFFAACLLPLSPKLAAAQEPRLKINILIRDNFDSISNDRLNLAITILESVFNSSEFKTRLQNANFNVGNRGLTSDQITEMILTGQDEIDKPKDYSIDLRLSIYPKYNGGNEFGKTNMTTRITTTHRCYILNNDLKCYVTHLSHEYMHQIGFRDKKKRKGLKWVKTYSVPYKVGNIIEELIKNDNHCVAQKSNSLKNEK